MTDVAIKGTKEERAAFTDVFRHYEMSDADLRTRMVAWDKIDTLFRSHINEASWPYRATVFDPRIFTALYEKTARILANKPQGRLIPREGGDALGAKINNELLMFQWDDNERVSGTPLLAKWALMDINARKYGASFALCKWRWERQVQRDSVEDNETAKPTGKSVTWFDGPDFKPLNNRDVLVNPSYSTVKNWFQHRDYLTLNELEDVNDSARSKPVYKNLDLLKDSLSRSLSGTGDTRDSNYAMKNLTIKGLTDYLGKDPSFKTVEVITEYRPDRWITFAPNHGLVLRDIPNPYKHQQIPVVQLKYYPIDEDIYGLSEVEPVEKLQKAVNALVCQYLDAINMSLYAPLKIRTSAVQMHTLEFGPGKKWLMNDPATDVIAHDQTPTGVTEFTSTYRFLVGAMQEALGDTSVGVSNLNPGGATKTATEIKDSALSRSARDNFNLMYLGEALKKQMMFWHKMNQQYLLSGTKDKQKVIQIVGKDAIKFFQGEGLDGNALDEKGIEMMSNPDLAGTSVQPQDLMTPNFPVSVGGGVVPKMTVEGNGGVAHLIIEENDLSGNYDYIPDIGSMGNLADEITIKAKAEAIQFATGVDPKTGQPSGLNAMMQQEGKKVKATDLLTSYLEDIGFKDADQYIENVQTPPQAPQQIGGVDPNAINGGAIQGQVPGGASMGPVAAPGMVPGAQTMA